MDKKVEELVEWVARKLASHKHYDFDLLTGILQDEFIEQARIALSHPDLALIDRESIRPRLSEGDCDRIHRLFRKDTKAKIIKAYYDAQIELINEYNYEPVIPLAEALKEQHD